MARIYTRLVLAAAAAIISPAAFAQFQPTMPLPRSLLSHTAVTLDGRVYVAGGISSDSAPNYLNNVYYCAQILPDGQLGPWLAASPMPEFMGLGMHAAAAYNGRLYVLGGTNRYGSRNTVYFSGVNADGTLAGWQRGTWLPERLYAHSAAVLNGRLYITGGISVNSGATSKTWSAPVNADGSLGAWRAEKPLPVTLFGHTSFARGGRLFVLGGSTGSSLYSAGGGATGLSGAVYSAAANADGTLGDWQLQPSLPDSVAFYGLAVSDKSVYMLGGFDGAISNAVYFAPFAQDGTLGSWVALNTLPKGLLSLAAVSNGDYLYSIGGGVSYIDNPVPDIYFSKLKTDLRAFVQMTPDVINKKASGKWVTVIMGLPEADAASVDPASVRITSLNGQAVAPILPDPKWTAKLYTGDSTEFTGLQGVTYLMIKFSRQAVASLIPEGDFSIGIEGLLADGRAFRGESMNRALKAAKTPVVPQENGAGLRMGQGGAKVNIPKGAFKGNPDLLLAAAPEDQEALTQDEKDRRGRNMGARGLKAASAPFEFGPHGMVFDKPVTISLPYDPASLPEGADENALKIAYWNDSTGEWEILPSAVSKADRTVSADVAHFSVYQVLADAPAPAPVAADTSTAAVAAPVVTDTTTTTVAAPVVTDTTTATVAAPVVTDTTTATVAAPVVTDTATATVAAPVVTDTTTAAPAAPESPAAPALPAVPEAFAVSEAYAFPNPSLPGQSPKLHLTVTGGSKASVRVYTASGRLERETSVSGGPAACGAAQCYELPLGSGLPSGVYYYSAEVDGGAKKIRKAGKFAVIR